MGRWGGPQPVGSLVAAAALPWLALLGVPRREGAKGRAGAAFGLAAPVLALAAALEHQAGRPPGALALELGAGCLLLAGLTISSGAQGRWVPGLWLALVVALPLLAATLAWNDAPGGGPPWLQAAAGVSPLEWAFHRAGPGQAPPWHDVLAPGALVLVLVGLARRRA